ncbi:hypothetical protein PT277_02260 [Acetobacteraceae bacterium ESL0709]|nr:hypothetical protein [Acetobacteraceae bacterium ESL0697]MDF7677526.1 hypothetical protein [Acetobacteraceae bacterium ESL0709]
MTDNKSSGIGQMLDYPLDTNFSDKNHLNGGDIIGGRLEYDGGIETALGMRDYYGGFSYSYIRYNGAGLESDKNAYPHTELRLYTNQKPNEPPHLVIAQYKEDPAQTSSLSEVIVSPSFETQDGRIVSIALDKASPPRGELYFLDDQNNRHYLPANSVGSAWIGQGQSAVQWIIQDSNSDILVAPRDPSNPDLPPQWTRFYSAPFIDQKFQQQSEDIAQLQAQLAASTPSSPADDIQKETERTQTAETALQPKGDYATHSDVNSVANALNDLKKTVERLAVPHLPGGGSAHYISMIVMWITGLLWIISTASSHFWPH